MSKTNSKCYRYRTINYDTGLLDSFVDATYVVHLEGNGRMDNIMDGLNSYRPTSVVHILLNKGYKRCQKELLEQNSIYDLIDAFIQIFRHAEKKGYNNILVLEDDFIFSDLIKKDETIHNLEYFFNDMGDNEYIYYLGCLPYIIVPYDENHYYNYLTGGNHACIYPPKLRQAVLKDTKNIDEWELYLKRKFDNYTYYTPLCFQLFPETENRNNWKTPLRLEKLQIYAIELSKLDKQVEPGYSIFNFIAKMWFYLFLLLLVTLVIVTMKNIL